MNPPAAESGRWPAPAKINLFLHVTGRRRDHYHQIQTLYQLLDWGDAIEIEPAADGRILRVFGCEEIPAEQDLAIRAARALQGFTGCRQGARIGVRKEIPTGAGLGGGSSDAATVLLALNELWRCGLSAQELARIGLELGADVPVFIHGRSAWAGGIGEILQPVDLGERHYVLVLPGLHIATREIFSDADLRRDTPPLLPGEFDFRACRNDCEPVVLKRYPAMQAIMKDLSLIGQPRLTGTGSCIFLPVRDEIAAADTTSRLKSRYNVRAVRGVDRSAMLLGLSGGR